MLLLFQDCKSSQTKTQNYLDKSRVKFRSRVRVQQQRHMTETRNNYQDVHDVTQLEMSLTVSELFLSYMAFSVYEVVRVACRLIITDFYTILTF